MVRRTARGKQSTMIMGNRNCEGFQKEKTYRYLKTNLYSRIQVIQEQTGKEELSEKEQTGRERGREGSGNRIVFQRSPLAIQ